MDIRVENINAVQRRVHVTTPSEVVSAAFDKAYQEIRKKLQIQGFRRGKAPLTLVKRLYKQEVTRDVTEDILKEGISSFLHNGKDPQDILVAVPVVEAFSTVPSEDQDFSFSAIMDVMPSIELADHYKSLELTCNKYEVSDASVDDAIARVMRKRAKFYSVLKDQYADHPEAIDLLVKGGQLDSYHLSEKEIEDIKKMEPVDLPVGTEALSGMLGFVDYDLILDGITLDASYSVKRFPVVIGDNNFTVFASKPELVRLDQDILGMKAGESKDVELVFSEDSTDRNLAGKTVTCRVILSALRSLDVSFVTPSQFGYETLEEFKEATRSELLEFADRMTKQEVEQKLSQKLISLILFEIPPALVDRMIDNLISQEESANDQERQKCMQDAQLRKSMHSKAKFRIRGLLIFEAIAKKEQLSVTDEECANFCDQLIQSKNPQYVPGTLDLSQFPENIKESAKEQIIFNKAYDFVRDNANITYQTVPF